MSMDWLAAAERFAMVNTLQKSNGNASWSHTKWHPDKDPETTLVNLALNSATDALRRQQLAQSPLSIPINRIENSKTITK
jgi:hypothetical protein